MLSRVRLFATPWTVAYQAPPSMGFSRQEYWSGLLFPSPGNLPNLGIEPTSPAQQVESLPLNHLGSLFNINTLAFYITYLIVTLYNLVFNNGIFRVSLVAQW